MKYINISNKINANEESNKTGSNLSYQITLAEKEEITIPLNNSQMTALPAVFLKEAPITGGTTKDGWVLTAEGLTTPSLGYVNDGDESVGANNYAGWKNTGTKSFTIELPTARYVNSVRYGKVVSYNPALCTPELKLTGVKEDMAEVLLYDFGSFPGDTLTYPPVTLPITYGELVPQIVIQDNPVDTSEIGNITYKTIDDGGTGIKMAMSPDRLSSWLSW